MTAELFAITVPPWELILRGTLMYWFLFLVFRFVMRRDVGAIGVADVLLLVLIADASQNAMSGGYESVTDGAILVATIVGWNWLLDWAAFRFPVVRRLAEAPPLRLVHHGRVMRANLRRELMTLEELQSKLREQGITDLADVKLAYMEPDGQISVVKRSSPPADVPHAGKRSVPP